MIALDTTALSLFLHPDAEIPLDPSTGLQMTDARERMQYLVERLQSRGERILIPAPALSEFLTVADADYLTEINQSIWFEIGAFDQREAVEAAVALRNAIDSGRGKKSGLVAGWQVIKVDRQIVAIAKVREVSAIITTDQNIIALARESGVEVVHVADLPLPPTDPQAPLPLDVSLI